MIMRRSIDQREGHVIREMSGLRRDELCALWLWAHSMDYLGEGD